jgi:hypothetical protein
MAPQVEINVPKPGLPKAMDLKTCEHWGNSAMVEICCPYCDIWQAQPGPLKKSDRITCIHCKAPMELGDETK